jgi:fluoride exporter
MKLYLLIGLGGALGSVARFVAGEWVQRIATPGFPWGTLVVNITGSFVIGFFATLTDPAGRLPASPEARHFFMTGVLGGFTTFSSFSWQTLGLVHGGEWGKASANVAGSVVLCLAAVWLGHLAASAFRQKA